MLHENRCCHLYPKWAINHDIPSSMSWVLPSTTFQAAPKWEMLACKMKTFTMCLMNSWGDSADMVRFHTTARRQALFIDVWWVLFSCFFFFFLCKNTVTLSVPGASQTLMCVGITVCPSKMQTPRPHRWGRRNAFHKPFFFFFLLIEFTC